MRTLLPAGLLLLAACSGGTKDDLDGDGYTGGLDCDERDPEVHADAIELCDGVDNDCDGTIDDGVADEVWPDADADGYGDASAPVIFACEVQAGTVPNQLDCDDTRDDVNPDQTEDCSDVDRNCDGSPTSGGSQLVYYDGDGDGYGDTAKTYTLCDAGADYVAIDGDCDDEDPGAYPGADEYCNEIDDDCDFVIDEDPVDPQTLYTDGDSDGFGAAGGSVTSCPMPGLADNDLDCDDSNDEINPAAAEVCNEGIDDDCDPLSDEDTTVVWYQDLDSDGFGDDLVTFTGCEPPPYYVATGGDCDDGDPALNPIAYPDCVITHCGTISVSETWSGNLEHRVTCDVHVKGAARPVLTIEDGVTVWFDVDTELIVADGSEGQLIVDGALLGVVFESSELVPTYGDWGGLVIADRDQGSRLIGLTVSHAGGNGLGGITLESDAVLDRVVASNNLNDGLYVTGAGAEPLIHDSLFVDNTDHGVYIGAGAGLSRAPVGGGAGPSFEGNFVTGNAGIGITIPGSHADELATTSSYTGNGQDVIELLTGTLRFTGRWYQHGVPYVVAASQTISVEDGPQAALTIDPGVTLYYDTSAELKIGNLAGGTLTIDALADPVLMTGTDTVVSTGVEWDGVTFGPHDLGSSIDGLVIEHGGANTKGNLYVNDSEPLIANVVSRYSDNNGLYVSGTSAAPEIRDSEFSDNDTDGVYVASTSGLARSVLGPTFVGNQLIGNRAPIVVPPNIVGEIDLATVFLDNDELIGIHGGDMLEDGAWYPLADGYRVYGDIDIQGPQDPVLVIQAGVVMSFDRDAALNVGTSDDGALIVSGTSAAPVLMTSSAQAPGEGDWEGIEIGRNGPLRAQSQLQWLIIEYAGGSDVQDGGAIEVVDRDDCQSKEPYVAMSDITIRQSSKAGLWAESYTWFSADRFDVDGALDGCFAVFTPSFTCPPPDVAGFTDNLCTNSAIFGVWPLVKVGLLPNAGNTFPGPVLIEDDRLATSVTMPLIPVPYRLTKVLKVYETTLQPVLTVSAGNVLQFESGAGLEVGVSAAGGLVLEDGVTLESGSPVPQPGDWLGVRMGNNCLPSSLAGTISHGGANTFGDVYVNGCGDEVLDPLLQPLTFGDLTLTDSSTCGLHLGLNNSGPYDLGTISYLGNLGGDLCP
jgi:hypothetical protein